MNGNNENNPNPAPEGGENGLGNTGPNTGTNAGGTNPSEVPTEGPMQVIAKVDMTRKPESAIEPVNLLNDEQFDEVVNAPTEGDKRKAEAEAGAVKPDVNAFRNQTANPNIPPASGKEFNPTLAQQQATAWVKIIDMGARFGLKAWSGQADNTGLEVSEKDKEVLAEQIAIALSEYKVVVPILLTVLTTLGAMYATPFMNAKESKKKIDDFRAQQKAEEEKKRPANLKPDLDPSTGTHKKKKGGQYKAT